MNLTRIVFVLLAYALISPNAQADDYICYPQLPTPQLTATSREDFTVDGNLYTRYRLEVSNWASFPGELFAAAPELPPCGVNTASSRSWVDLYAANGHRLGGFCGYTSPSSLLSLWFAIPRGSLPPEEVYIVITDRACNIRYTSNLASTSCLPGLPLPHLELVGTEDYMTEDGIYTRYIMDVVNWSEYPAEFFAPRPDLPPCGLNHQASRVWVRVLDESGTLVHEFCELSAPSQLQGLWHGVRGGSDPPNLRVEIWDRECDMTYRSNMVFGAVPTAGRSWGVLKSAFK